MRAGFIPLYLSLLSSLPLTPLAAPFFDSSNTDDRFTLYDLPTPLTGPCDLVASPDGALWGIGILVDTIFRLDPQTGDVENYAIPFSTPIEADHPIQPPPAGAVPESIVANRTALACAIRVGADGNIYAANGLRNQLVRLNTTTKAIALFQVTPDDPVGNLFPFNDVAPARDGVWVTATTANVFAFFSFATELFTTYALPTALALPLGIYVASNDVVYVAELLGNSILTLALDPPSSSSTSMTATLTEHSLPQAQQYPAVMRAERNGYVYFSLFVGNGLGRISMETHEIELYHTGQPLLLGSENTIDAHGGVWLSSFDTDTLCRLDTETLGFSYVGLPGSFAQVLGAPGVLGDVPPFVDVAVNYAPGDAVWFTSVLTNRVGRYDISGLYE